MFRTVRASSAVIALGCVIAGTVVAGCDEDEADNWDPLASDKAQAATFTGTKKIKVDGHQINVSCSGKTQKKKPIIMLMPGHGDGLTKMAGIQKTLSKDNRVCSYDRLGEGASDKPDSIQSYEDSGKILTGVLKKLAGDRHVVLAGHSMGGAVAARYAPEHQDQVKGLVLIDATSPSAVADTTKQIPKSAKGLAGQVRLQVVQINKGVNKEKLKATDSEVPDAGDMPVEVMKHGKKYLSAVPKFGPTLEHIWTKGQREWLKLSGNSHYTVAKTSTHYIYVDQPALTVKKIQAITDKAAK